MARLTEPIDLKSLSREGVTFQVSSDLVKDHASDSDEEDDIDEDGLTGREFEFQQFNKECLGIFDEDTYEEGEPFERIARKMFDLIPSGKIKKRVIREGTGDLPQDHAVVKIHYNAYVELKDEPFDSTYMRRKPLQFALDTGKVIAGLDFGVRSMRETEKSQFLIAPEYAYGNCLPGRIEPNATVLFEVEVLDIVNTGALVTYEQLPEDEQKTFREIYKYCTALCEKAKMCYSERNFKNAIKDYNTAACKLDKAMLNSKEDIENHRDLCMKLYTNLTICYTRNEQPVKGCTNAKKVYDLTENGEVMRVPAKVYFNHARCLRMLSEYEEAARILEKARRMEPNNPAIANELLNLDIERQDHKRKRMQFAKHLVGQSNN